MFGWGKREKQVVAAVVFDADRNAFFVSFSPRWRGYSLPTRPLEYEDVHDPVVRRNLYEVTAKEAVNDDTGLMLPATAEAIWMEHLEISGTSGNTGKETDYEYEIVTVDPQIEIPDGHFGGDRGWMTFAQIESSRAVTWSTREILRKLLTDQHVALAVICRATPDGRQYLMVENRYGALFFPVARQRDYPTLERAIISEFRLKANFNGGIRATLVGEVELQQGTKHLGRRTYVFHVFSFAFAGMDLCLDNSPLEEALLNAAIHFEWVSEEEILHPTARLSVTVSGVQNVVFQAPCEECRS